jgi:lipopolysaccharide/colanic/teichoic acid biosynthesis glycosyltransferase
VPDPVQRAIGLVLLVLTGPLLIALAIAVRLETRGPALFRASRMGPGGHPFECLKLRTMRANRSDQGPGVTSGSDSRITRIGGLLRRFRLDELPQLWNVVRGQMRLVGPRPEDPRYVDFDLPYHSEVFTARPGIAGLTQLVYADEGKLLEGTADPDAHYRQTILPGKVAIDAAYLRHRSTKLDLWILAQTPRAMLGRPIHLPAEVQATIEDPSDA